MTIETKRLMSELKRIDSVKEELELKIMEREVEIQNIKATIETQEKRIAEIKQKLSQEQ